MCREHEWCLTITKSTIPIILIVIAVVNLILIYQILHQPTYYSCDFNIEFPDVRVYLVALSVGFLLGIAIGVLSKNSEQKGGG